MTEICPNCDTRCRVDEHSYSCPKCGCVFIKYINIKYSDDIGNRRSTENVDRD